MIEITCDKCGKKREIALDGHGGVDFTLLRMCRWLILPDKQYCSTCGVDFVLRKRIKAKLIRYVESLDW